MTKSFDANERINEFIISNKLICLRYLIFSLIFHIPLLGISQTYYTFHTSGNWTDAANWSPSYPGTNLNANTYVTIGANCTVDNQTTISIGSNSGIDVLGGGILNFNGTLEAFAGGISGISVTSWDVVNFDGTLIVGENAEFYMESYGGTGWWGVFNFGPNTNFSTFGGTISLNRTSTLNATELNIFCNPAPYGVYVSGWDSNINLANTIINVDWVATNLPSIGQDIQLIQLNNNCTISGFNASNFNIESIPGLIFTPVISPDNKSIVIQVTGLLPILYQNSPNAKIRNSQTYITWTIVSQINNEKYIIEYSLDGIIFKSIGEIAGDGSLTQTKQYQYIHTSPQIGTNYYRVKQIDYDGQQSYSDILTVFMKGADNDVSIYPNPATSEVTITSVASTTLQIMDVYGRELTTQDITEGQNIINISGLPSGLLVFSIGDHRYRVLKE